MLNFQIVTFILDGSNNCIFMFKLDDDFIHMFTLSLLDGSYVAGLNRHRHHCH